MSDHLELFFNPNGVAIIGASTDPLKLSHGVVRNLKNCGYQGPIYPVTPRATRSWDSESTPTSSRSPIPSSWP